VIVAPDDFPSVFDGSEAHQRAKRLGTVRVFTERGADQEVELIRRIARDLTILIVEHDMEVVMGLAHTITVLNYGEVLAEGRPAEIQANPRVQEVYLKT